MQECAFGCTCKQVSTMWETGCLLTVSMCRGAILGGKKMYLGRYDVITPYPPFSACQRGQDRMDCIRGLWMTRAINKFSSTMAVGHLFLLLGSLGMAFYTYKNTYGWM